MYIMLFRCVVVILMVISGYKDRRSEIEMVCFFDCVISGLFIKVWLYEFVVECESFGVMCDVVDVNKLESWCSLGCWFIIDYGDYCYWIGW